MSTWPEATALRAFLARVARRLSWIAAAEGAAAGLAVALLAALVVIGTGWTRGAESFIGAPAGVLALAGALIGMAAMLVRPRPVARLVERRAPGCRNLIITAAELLDRPDRVRPYMGARVFREAARTAAGLDATMLFPARRALLALAGVAALWVLTAVVVAAQPAILPGLAVPSPDAAAITGVEITVTPPAYAGQPARTYEDPERVEALAGSRIGLTVRAAAAGVSVETVAGRQSLAATGTRVFAGDLDAVADGYLAIEPAAAGGRAGVRRLIGLTVTPDRAPRVRVTVPGHDLFLPDAERSIDVVVEAEDDLAMASLRLRHTRVTGSGEQFTFTDGDIALAIERANDRTWGGRATLRLDALGLNAGDVLVYRGVATDRRPGATAVESDAFLIEITAPGAIAAEGFALDDEQDRYALSQQMVILKTERLFARAPTMAGDSVVREALTLAAEQRSVRAEFVFMMGGELAEEIEAAANLGDLNEEDHVEADDEAIAGRLANQGRVALIQAIRAMSRANAALTATTLDRALVEEKAALEFLQGAFARTRYILRALTQREQLDMERRLTGALSAAARDVRPAGAQEAGARVVALREALRDAATLGLRAEDAVRASGIALRVLQIDPSAPALQQTAAALGHAAAALEAGREADARDWRDRAVVTLAQVIRAELPAASVGPQILDLGQLDGAMTDALRRTVR